ncbi:DUF3102 domain-containing protein [Methylobacterium tardum]|nr:DUF3102 domain-containing protein [Methylobacterium tardum]
MDAEVAREARSVVERYHQRTRTYVINTGSDLLEMKARLDRGTFYPWAKSEMGISPRMAQNFMRAAKRFGDKSEIISRLPPTAIYALAAPSTPDALCASVAERLEAGQKLTSKAVAAEIREARAAAKVKGQQADPLHQWHGQEEGAPERREPPQAPEPHEMWQARQEREARHAPNDDVGVAFLMRELGSEVLSAFGTRFGHQGFASVMAKAIVAADVARAQAMHTIMVPVDAFARIGLLSDANESQRWVGRMASFEASLNWGETLPPIVAVVGQDGRYTLIAGEYTFWTLRDRLSHETVPVHVVPATDPVAIAAIEAIDA